MDTTHDVPRTKPSFHFWLPFAWACIRRPSHGTRDVDRATNNRLNVRVKFRCPSTPSSLGYNGFPLQHHSRSVQRSYETMPRGSREALFQPGATVNGMAVKHPWSAKNKETGNGDCGKRAMRWLCEVICERSGSDEVTGGRYPTRVGVVKGSIRTTAFDMVLNRVQLLSGALNTVGFENW
jgi:hypothetical protein